MGLLITFYKVVNFPDRSERGSGHQAISHHWAGPPRRPSHAGTVLGDGREALGVGFARLASLAGGDGVSACCGGRPSKGETVLGVGEGWRVATPAGKRAAWDGAVAA